MSEYGFSLTRIFPYKDIIVDSIPIRENAGQRKPVLRHIFAFFSRILNKHRSQINAPL